ncbi:tape measure protein [Comamonas sp. AG1104]|uniref:tape measure protein n=1 Tax=Comamonas sp. AG1104 TaxID=2183900 RepID=UPI000E0B4A6A|nr:tape measure protein [Comamonas sp. AG1104]RDI10736.1 tape measure domain-containing protein [Comamonas sp. AG1104]
MTDKQISLQIDTGVTGRESIVGLADDLENVAKVLEGEVAVEARTAAAKLRELAQQDAAITTFTKLEAEARSSATSLRQAETEARNYGRQISALGPPTEKEAAALRQLNTAADSARSTFDQQKQALSQAQGELQRFGVAGQNAQQAQQRLRQEVEQVRESVLTLVPAHQGAAAGAQNAAASMVRSHRQIGDGVESISKQLDRLQKFYIGLQSLQGMKNLAFDLAATADQANNLQGRMKLVTGEGENFKRSWEGVTEVALRTHSALEGTGVLFSRIAQAGLDAGLSAQRASQQSLGLTETINQTIQISGASTEASSAAITQLIQGLQSGVLRGEEFNSVMEQAPRLARALADGLGVTTGELRKMAESGLLTTQTVIAALQGQSAAVAAEFQRLPPTVGRAMQDLSTQWTLYVQKVDQANGASAAAAKAIQLLANNLQSIAGLLMDLGQAAAAFTALRLAQHFLGIGQATQVAATGIAAANAQLVATQAAAAGAAASTSRFAAVMGGLKTFTLVGIVSNIKDIGTWIGESAAKLAGYKDRTEELEKAEKAAAAAARELAAARAAEAQKTQDAADKLFDLSKAARNAVAEFEQLTKSGKASADALKSVTEGFDLTKIQGIKDFAATLDKLGETAKITASETEAAWAKALSGKDLAVFEANARAAFLGSSREAQRLAQLTDAVLTEAIKRAGLEYDVLRGNIAAASRSAINDTQALIDQLGKLKEEGVDTGRVLNASFSKAIESADSEAALKAIREQIESVRGALGQPLADGLLDQAKKKADALKDALDAATPGINSVREAFKQLGITSDETLKKTAADAKAAYDVLRDSGTASAREMGEAFKKSADAAIAANKGIAPAWVQAEAAMRGYEVAVDSAGRATLRLKGSVDDSAGSHSRAANAIDQHRTALERLNAEREREIASQEKANELATRELQLMEAKRNAGTIRGADAVPAFESQAQADAWLAKWKEQYVRDNPFSTQSGGQLGNFMHDMTMFEWDREVRAMELRNTMKGNGNAENSSKTPLEAMVSRQVSTINLQLNGQPYGQVNTDPSGAASLHQYLTELGRQKGASSS